MARWMIGLCMAGMATAQPTQAYAPQVNYMLQCMGCHTSDGGGEKGRVPSLRKTMVPFAQSAEGRKFLVRVPGVAQSRLTDAEVADLLNWAIVQFSDRAVPASLRKFDAAEVGAYRTQPLTQVKSTRRELMRLLGLTENE